MEDEFSHGSLWSFGKSIQPKLLKPNLVVLAELAGVNGQVNKCRNDMNYHEIVFLPILLVLTLGELDILSPLPIRACTALQATSPLALAVAWRIVCDTRRHQNLTLDEFSPDDNSAFEAPQVHRTCEGGKICLTDEMLTCSIIYLGWHVSPCCSSMMKLPS